MDERDLGSILLFFNKEGHINEGEKCDKRYEKCVVNGAGLEASQQGWEIAMTWMPNYGRPCIGSQGSLEHGVSSVNLRDGLLESRSL